MDETARFDREIRDFQRRLASEPQDLEEFSELDVRDNSALLGFPEGRELSSETTLSDILKYHTENLVVEVEGQPVEAGDLLANMILQGALRGRVTFLEGNVLHLPPKEWVKMVSWIYDRVDGKPGSSVKVESVEDSKLPVEYVNDWRRPNKTGD